jgi:histidinol-phosphatase
LTISLDDDLEFAHELADAADRISLEVYRRTFEVRRKPDRTPVTEADIAIEAALADLIVHRLPDDAVLGEESGRHGPDGAARLWVLDPIDGTKSFAAHIQVWGTLIGLCVDGEPVVGVASAPALGERYAAAAGGGATLNGRPIHVSATPEVSDAVFCSMGIHSFEGTPWIEGYRRLTSEVYANRGFGDFWGHALVARGSADAMVESGLRTWDWAALKVIIDEAGGAMTQIDGSPLADHCSVLTTNGALHRPITERLLS